MSFFVLLGGKHAFQFVEIRNFSADYFFCVLADTQAIPLGCFAYFQLLLLYELECEICRLDFRHNLYFVFVRAAFGTGEEQKNQKAVSDAYLDDLSRCIVLLQIL